MTALTEADVEQAALDWLAVSTGRWRTLRTLQREVLLPRLVLGLVGRSEHTMEMTN